MSWNDKKIDEMVISDLEDLNAKLTEQLAVLREACDWIIKEKISYRAVKNELDKALAKAKQIGEGE